MGLRWHKNFALRADCVQRRPLGLPHSEQTADKAYSAVSACRTVALGREKGLVQYWSWTKMQSQASILQGENGPLSLGQSVLQRRSAYRVSP